MDRIHEVHATTKNLQKDFCGPGGGLQDIKQLPDLIICGLEYGPACQKAVQKKDKHQWTVEKPLGN